MKKIIFLLSFVAFFAIQTDAQVTIGSEFPPNKSALLDLNEDSLGSTKGLLLPRVALKSTVDASPLLEHVEGMTVYNTGTTNTSESGYVAGTYVSPGLYYNNGTQWERLHFGATNWFYMPSIAIPTSTISSDWENIDLYEQYKYQFTGADTETFMASIDAPTEMPYIPRAEDMYYYVTYYSKDVFEIESISIKGEMKYKVIGSASDCSYINVVFVLK